MGKKGIVGKSSKPVKKATNVKAGFKNTNVHMDRKDLKGLLDETYRKGKGANENYGDYQVRASAPTTRFALRALTCLL